MGRNKIKIERIKEDRIRQVSFYKRKKGLLKKAMELSILCDIEVFFTIVDKNNGLSVFNGKGNPYDFIKRFLPLPLSPKETYSNEHYHIMFEGNDTLSYADNDDEDNGSFDEDSYEEVKKKRSYNKHYDNEEDDDEEEDEEERKVNHKNDRKYRRIINKRKIIKTKKKDKNNNTIIEVNEDTEDDNNDEIMDKSKPKKNKDKDKKMIRNDHDYTIHEKSNNSPYEKDIKSYNKILEQHNPLLSDIIKDKQKSINKIIQITPIANEPPSLNSSNKNNSLNTLGKKFNFKLNLSQPNSGNLFTVNHMIKSNDKLNQDKHLSPNNDHDRDLDSITPYPNSSIISNNPIEIPIDFKTKSQFNTAKDISTNPQTSSFQFPSIFTPHNNNNNTINSNSHLMTPYYVDNISTQKYRNNNINAAYSLTNDQQLQNKRSREEFSPNTLQEYIQHHFSPDNIQKTPFYWTSTPLSTGDMRFFGEPISSNIYQNDYGNDKNNNDKSSHDILSSGRPKTFFGVENNNSNQNDSNK